MPPKSNSTQRLSTAVVTIAQADAQQLDVLSGEEVILMTQNEPIRAVIAKLRISTPTTPHTAIAAAGSPVQTNKRPALPAGRIQLQSMSLWNILKGEDIQQQQSSSQFTSPTRSTPMPPSTTPFTPSTPSTPFSFRSVSSSPTTVQTPSPKNNNNKSTTSSSNALPLWMVARESEWGDRIWQRFCGAPTTTTTTNCTFYMRRVSPPAPSSSSHHNANVTPHLLRAFLTGQYGQTGQCFTISTVGRYMTWQVAEVMVPPPPPPPDRHDCAVQTAPDDHTKHDWLNQQMHNLSLQSTAAKDNAVDMAKVWEHASCAEMRLYPITEQTQFVIVDGETDDGNNDDSSANDNVPPTTQPTLQYVVGLEREQQAALDVLQAPLLRADVFQQRGLRPPRGVLLHGPSGTGKTALTRQLAQELATKNFCQVQFVDCVQLQTKLSIVGEAERELSRYFQKRRKPTLLVLDDVHLICPRRGATHNIPGVDQLASTLLSLMDGVDSSPTSSDRERLTAAPLVILAVTPNPSLLDPALRRPGRLDTEIEIPLPDEPATRAAILKFHCQQIGDLAYTPDAIKEAEWLQLGKLAKGFNGSDCMLAIKEATRAMQLGQFKSADNIQPSFITYQHLVHGIRQTKPSSIKAVTVEIPQVKWSDIGGMDDVKRELREAIEQPIAQADLYTQLRLPTPRGILLYGPPGCSKTLTARAMATEGKMNFLAVKGPELLSKWLGESERALASLFRRARMASPSIIFFDEMDAIASQRGSGDSTSSSRMLSQLLTELDGISSGGTKNGKAPRVIVVGATNRPDLLDSALTRPGRMDRMIYVGPPDFASRERIFEIGLKGRPCDDSVDISALARGSEGFSGAEIIAICRDAALLALEEQTDESSTTPVITSKHLESSIYNTNRQISPEMLAFYEGFRPNSNRRGT